MRVLGLSTLADASAAVVEDGRILFAAEEERFNRVKHYEGMPWQALEACLALDGRGLAGFDLIAVGWDPWRGWPDRLWETARAAVRAPEAFFGKVSRGGGYVGRCREMLSLRRVLRSRYPDGGPVPPVQWVPHHQAHAASAYLPSPWDAADIIVADGVGEAATVSLLRAWGTEIRLLRQWRLPHSLGHVYAAVTGFLGFRMTCDEGKTMALAAFGRDAYRPLFQRLIQLDEDGTRLWVDTGLLDYHAARRGVFSPAWIHATGLRPRRGTEPILRRHEDLACSLQAALEERVLRLLRTGFGTRPWRPLCAAGGLFLNSVLNGRIVREYNRRLFVQPAAGDNGVSVGAALWAGACHDPGGSRRVPLEHASLGPDHGHEDAAAALAAYGLPVRRSDDVYREVADALLKGNVVAWYQGRMEFGPRALGNRSILADPAQPGIKDQLNRKVKHREPFRPFACAVLLEDAPRYFEDVEEAPFMLKVFYLKEPFRVAFPAISHVDGSCRIQTVTEAQNPPLHRLLQALKARSGHGIVLNTSMNVAGEPIVNTPMEAVRLLRKTDVDLLAMHDLVCWKREALARAE